MKRPTNLPRSLRRATLILVAAGFVSLAACGGDDAESAASTTVDAPGTTAPATTVHDHDAPTVGIGAADYAFIDVPETIAAGTQLTLHNTSEVEVHELIAVKLPAGDERTSTELTQLAPAELGALIGPAPAAVLVAPPAADGFPVVGDGVLREPGRYLLLCSIPIGADPDEYLAAAQAGDGPPVVAGGGPHFTAGMHATVTVQ